VLEGLLVDKEDTQLQVIAGERQAPQRLLVGHHRDHQVRPMDCAGLVLDYGCRPPRRLFLHALLVGLLLPESRGSARRDDAEDRTDFIGVEEERSRQAAYLLRILAVALLIFEAALALKYLPQLELVGTTLRLFAS